MTKLYLTRRMWNVIGVPLLITYFLESKLGVSHYVGNITGMHIRAWFKLEYMIVAVVCWLVEGIITANEEHDNAK